MNETGTMRTRLANIAVAGEPSVNLSRQAYEVPRLGCAAEVPVACDVGDAAGLRRVVEAQAVDLVRLRRALVSAQTLAAKRLHIIRNGAPAAPAPQRLQPETARDLRSEILRTENDIRLVIELSRWRRLGRRLGLAKRLPWEGGDWRNLLVGADGNARTRAAEPSLAELQTELARLRGFRDELRRSRWRKLGHKLGLAKRLPWDEGPGLPNDAARSALPEASEVAADIWSAPPASSHEGFLEHTSRRFLEECRGFAVDVILDVGANEGQFAQGLRRHGYQGHIVSFEPLTRAHTALAQAATDDPLWDVVDRCAVGAQEGTAEINIAGNSYSSSLLPMLERHSDAAPSSKYQGKESCPVITLDAFIRRTFSDPTTLFALKIDTQGFEGHVLAGLGDAIHQVKVIVCEMSLVPLYEGAPSMTDLCQLLSENGCRCVALGPAFEDPRSGQLLQVDGVFAKRD